MFIDVFRAKLLNGEKILWSGQPGQGIILTGRDAVMIPFSLVWCGGAVFWETNVLRMAKASIFFKLWGIPFILVGIFLVFGRLVLDSYIRKRMHYAVTNQRILIMRAKPFSSFTALSIDRLPQLNLTGNSRGRGSIHFGSQAQAMNRNGFAAWIPSLDAAPKFIAIEQAQIVFGEIERAMQAP